MQFDSEANTAMLRIAHRKHSRSITLDNLQVDA